MKMRLLIGCFAVLGSMAPCIGAEEWEREYAAAQQRLGQGWNTWNTQSVFSHVLLPEALSVTVGVHRRTLYSSEFLDLAQPGGAAAGGKQVELGLHAIDGSYSDLVLKWQGVRIRLQSATVDSDLLLLITPLENPGLAPIIDIEAGLLWNRPGGIEQDGDVLVARLPRREIRIFGTGHPAKDLNVPAMTPYRAFLLDAPVGVSTGRQRTPDEIADGIAGARSRMESQMVRRGVAPETVGAIQSALGWDTIFDPAHDRVISPVSRSWSVGWGGYVLFDWDMFFAGYMAGLFSRDLAYADILEMLNEETPAGFVPNYSGGAGIKSLDRSEPPVGSIVVWDTYRRLGDRWLLEAAFTPLLRWNRWWDQHRQVDGYLVLGSDPGNAEYDRQDGAVNTLQGAKYESGLDNSPMYDEVFFDARTHQMQLADVGLMSLYIADCNALAKIADQLGRKSDAEELRKRSDRYRTKLQTLWSPEHHLFLNRDLRNGVPSLRLSPTNFYPLLADAATEEQARQMVAEHLQNPREFGGNWVIPSTPRNDPAFKDQEYWRGRIWGPMNFLVYLGLRRYPLPEARADLARHSEALLLKEWKERGHIHENYNAITGEGDDVSSSDPFYHWGALLGAIGVLEGEQR